MKVKLRELVNMMSVHLEECHIVLDRRTGKISVIQGEHFGYAEDGEPNGFPLPDWQKNEVKLAKDILVNGDNYVDLPDKFEIHDYGIMEDFCYSIEEDKLRFTMLEAIRGSGAFGRFNSLIRARGIDQDWYDYRDNVYRELATRWCEENNLEYE